MQIAAITQRSMNGEIDFATALRERVAMLKGLDLTALERTWSGIEYCPGAKTLVATMKQFGATTALVSGGFTFFTARVAAELGFDLHRANVLLDNGSQLTGEVGEPILDRDAKLATLKELAEKRSVKLAATLAVGDGANDLAMLREAGTRHRLLRQAGGGRAGAEPDRAHGLDVPALRARLSGNFFQRI